MVQKKGPDIVGSQVESKKSYARTEKGLFPNQNQDSKNKGVSDLKRKMKKARSLKRISELDNLDAHLGHQYVQRRKPSLRTKPTVSTKESDGSLPNYMKPTTSSDARKEQLQISVHIPAIGDKKQSPRNTKNLNTPKASCTSTSFSSCANKKHAKVLTRKSSLKLLRPLMKKSLGIPLFPVINASKATCSSTLKDSKFPKELELSPGATEYEGTSAMKVCPYTYCSLNGHRHESLPPLKCFLAARRRSLKTQKSIKLKGVPSFRKRSQGKGRKQICAEEGKPQNSAVSALTEEENDDFFVEIFTKTKAEIPEVAFDGGNKQGTADDFSPDTFNNILPIDDSAKATETDFLSSLVDEYYSDLSQEKKPEEDGEMSTSEMELVDFFMELIECNSQVVEQEPGLLQDSNTFSNQSEAKETADHIDCKEETDEYSGDHLGYKDGIEILVAELLQEEYQEDKHFSSESSSLSEDEDDQADTACVSLENNCERTETNSPSEDVSDHSSELPKEDILEVPDQEDSDPSNDNISSLGYISYEKDVFEETEEACNPESEDCVELQIWTIDDLEGANEKLSDLQSECAGLEAAEDMVVKKDIEDPLPDAIIEIKDDDNVAKDISGFLDHGLVEAFENIAEGEDIKAAEETETCVCEEAPKHCQESDTSDDQPDEIGNFEVEKCGKDQFEEPSNTATQWRKSTEQCDDGMNPILQVGDELEEEEEEEEEEECLPAGSECITQSTGTKGFMTNSNQLLADTDSELKLRFNIARKRVEEDLEKIKAFNPRAPNFLPIEPDPDAETVDLRHQIVDERKNAEEWMIDYALQRAISKLAPARKRKVALLVEAFETVTPLPIYRAPVRHNSSDFIHARPIQACS